MDGPRPIQGHSAVLVTAGSLLLLVGWIGFNAGSTLSASGAIAGIAANTVLAAAAGGAGGLLLGQWRDGLFRPIRTVNGVLAGLVAVTAGADVLSLSAAILIAFAAGLVVVLAEDAIAERFGLDDVVGAVAVHGVAGALGTVALALFIPAEALAAGSRLAQIGVQALGVGVAFVWSFGVAYIACRAIDAMIGLRVSAEDEQLGLNAAEHGETLGTGALQETLYRMTFQDRDLTTRLDDSTGDEAAELAAVINPFLDEMERLMRSVSQRSREVRAAADLLGDASQASLAIAHAVAAEGTQLRGTTQTMAGGASDAEAALTRMETDSHAIAQGSQAISQEIADLNAVARDLSRSIQTVSAEATASGAVASSAEETTLAACEMMRSLEAASNQIDTIVATIEELAGQTNLLALNATIEAVRAGEAGRGFAVVAGEVKSLSEDTREATTTIGSVLRELRQASANAGASVMEVRGVVRQVTEALGTISGAAGDQSALTAAFSDRTATAAGEASNIASGVEVFAGRTREILTATHDLVRNAEAGADSLGLKARESLAQAERIDGEAVRLRSLAQDMEGVATRYRVRG
ncbi:MAG: methyl-accepting chemotaxis protein [Pseudomonadota bacterium]